ncbi:MAG TPA: hypothetical protein VFA20_05150 [Myxococcaceae bacterium]|nr:hypothetical protein [Myxococcaceae bacterium]
MKVGSEPKVQQQAQAEEPKGPDESKDAKAPDDAKESPKSSGAGDGFEDPKPQAPVDLGDMRAQQDRCEAANAGKPPPAGGYDMDDPDVQRELTRTDEGKRMLQDWNALKANGGIKTENHDFCRAAGGQWDGQSRTLLIDPKSYATEDGFFQTVAHEMTHASQSDGLNPARDGTAAPISDFKDADAWADHEMMNEARAEARAYDLARDRQFPDSSFKDLRKAYDAVMDSGEGTVEERREKAIQAVTEAMKANPKWQRERQTYVNDWNEWAAQSAASRAVP